MAERLELVTAWEQLRAGMIVVGVGCMRCSGATHRGILTSPTTSYTGEPAWLWAPETMPCNTVGVSKTGVDRRQVYRVVDPALESSDSSHHSTPKKQPARAR